MRRILSVLFTLALVLSTSTSGFANEPTMPSNTSGVGTSSIPQDTVEIIETGPIKEVDINELTQQPSALNSSMVQLSNESLDGGNELLFSIPFGTTRSITQSWTETIANQGEISFVFVSLERGQILNASLVCPRKASLNYDLFLYEMDANGNLVRMVSDSTTETYINSQTGKTVDEGISYINNSATVKEYAVIVSATKGGSTTDTFKLTISLDEKLNADTAEPNDSAFYAYGVDIGTTISGPSLHVVNDQDWFVMRTTSEFSASKISATAGYKTEVYTANGSQLILADERSDGAYIIRPGMYYIRVFANELNFTPNTYSLSITALSYSGESTIEIYEFVDSYASSKKYYISAPPKYQVDFKVIRGSHRYGIGIFDSLGREYETIFENEKYPLYFTTPGRSQTPPGDNGCYIQIFNDSSYCDFEMTVSTRYYP